ncbi:hypothetical protein I541_5709 [Mycobacteroides abscessus]|nr:hypothetical protein I541_5709 [Mycobacteroides abscessus]
MNWMPDAIGQRAHYDGVPGDFTAGIDHRHRRVNVVDGYRSFDVFNPHHEVSRWIPSSTG